MHFPTKFCFVPEILQVCEMPHVLVILHSWLLPSHQKRVNPTTGIDQNVFCPRTKSEQKNILTMECRKQIQTIRLLVSQLLILILARFLFASNASVVHKSFPGFFALFLIAQLLVFVTSFFHFPLFLCLLDPVTVTDTQHQVAERAIYVLAPALKR